MLLADRDDVRLIGPATLDSSPGHRCPTIAFSPLAKDPQHVAHGLVERGVQTSSGHYYAARMLDGVGIDPDRGVVRLSFVHYTSRADVERAGRRACATCSADGPRPTSSRLVGAGMLSR